MRRLVSLLLLFCCLAIAMPSNARQKLTSAQKIMQQQRKQMAKRLKAQKKAGQKQMKQNRKLQERRPASGGL